MSVTSAKAKIARHKKALADAEQELAEAEAVEKYWKFIFDANNGTIIKFTRNFGRSKQYEYAAIKVDGVWWITGARQRGATWTDAALVDEWLDHVVAEGQEISIATTFDTVYPPF